MTSPCVWLASDQELERFKLFVERKPQFDVVVDGLNVANIHKDKSKLSETVGGVPILWSRRFHARISLLTF